MALTYSADYGTTSSHTGVWAGWAGSTSTATTSCTSGNAVWYNWITADTCGAGNSFTATTAGDFSWTTWSADSGTGVMQCVHTPETAEQKAATAAMLAERNAAYNRAMKEAAAELRLAEQKAFALLKLCLSDEEVTLLETEKRLEVRGSKSGTVYRIRKGRSANIDVMENGKVKHKLCFHPQIQCPDYDTMLAQKLMLETDEPAALRIANVH